MEIKRLELSLIFCKKTILPLNYISKYMKTLYIFLGEVGIEPTFIIKLYFQDRCMYPFCHSPL